MCKRFAVQTLLWEISKKQPPEVFIKNSQNWKKNTRVFNTVYFSPRVNISFQLLIYQVIFLNLENLFSQYFSTFFSFHKLQLYLIHLRHWDQNKQRKASLPFISPRHPSAFYISLNFPTRLFIKTPLRFQHLRASCSIILC